MSAAAIPAGINSLRNYAASVSILLQIKPMGVSTYSYIFFVDLRLHILVT